MKSKLEYVPACGVLTFILLLLTSFAGLDSAHGVEKLSIDGLTAVGGTKAMPINRAFEGKDIVDFDHAQAGELVGPRKFWAWVVGRDTEALAALAEDGVLPLTHDVVVSRVLGDKPLSVTNLNVEKKKSETYRRSYLGLLESQFKKEKQFIVSGISLPEGALRPQTYVIRFRTATGKLLADGRGNLLTVKVTP